MKEDSTINHNGNAPEVNANSHSNGNGDRFHVVESEDDEAMLAFGRRLGYLEGLVEEKEKRIATLERELEARDKVIGSLLRCLERHNSGGEESSAESAPTNAEGPESKSGKRRLTNKERQELLRVLYEDFFLANPKLKEAVCPPSGKEMPRLYLNAEADGDGSFLYFDHWGTLRAGVKEGDYRTSKAAEMIKQHKQLQIRGI
jgi:hypothetical protein